jgi:hypothetical protein
MNLKDLANLGHVIGAIAVVISLIYIALQIRQNTRQFAPLPAQSVHEHFANWYHLIAADAELSQIAADGLRDHQSLSQNERTRFIAAFMSFLSYSQNAFLKWRQGIACAIAVAGLGTGHDESLRRAGWQSLLERAELSVWRGISPLYRERS